MVPMPDSTVPCSYLFRRIPGKYERQFSCAVGIFTSFFGGTAAGIVLLVASTYILRRFYAGTPESPPEYIELRPLLLRGGDERRRRGQGSVHPSGVEELRGDDESDDGRLGEYAVLEEEEEEEEERRRVEKAMDFLRISLSDNRSA